MREGILLVNLGTPEKPTTGAVRKYLREFLGDPDVLRMPAVLRFLLLHLIILPFRSIRSAAQYRKIWRPEGSPLFHWTQRLREELEQVERHKPFEIAMRYGKPSIRSALQKLLSRGASRITVLPLFPQYASATVGSIEKQVKEEAAFLHLPPEMIEIRHSYFEQADFIEAIAERGRAYLGKNPDQIFFSFHGLPMKQVEKGDWLYRHQCYETARAVAQRLNLSFDGSVVFQSRFGPANWLKPYLNEALLAAIQAGKRRFLVFPLSFVTDCLETLEEIGIRMREFALAHGAESLEVVPALNDDPRWIQAVLTLTSTPASPPPYKVGGIPAMRIRSQ